MVKRASQLTFEMPSDDLIKVPCFFERNMTVPERALPALRLDAGLVFVALVDDVGEAVVIFAADPVGHE